ncbi:hypothetical protein U9M48_024338 [Paspalum notatum var. saurae]|uniref:Reverse transcriptase domain-containing protein n=1 Tax=Paspalum notatum var. saurae TaxID=547442 RepID=A0AAQ3TM21_PASNO
MGRFRKFLDDVEVKELPLVGRKFTWSNERAAPTLVRLDRFFCCLDWEEIFSDSLLQSSASVVSDHCPLLLGLKVKLPGKRRFHFESFWPKLPGFLEAVEQNWNAPVSATCPVEKFFIKLQRLSKGLQKWSQRKVGNIKIQLNMAKEVLHQLEIARDRHGLSDGEEWLRKKLKMHCLGLASLERTIAQQRSRILYIREGDSNTSFFHQHARYRKKNNFIAKLQVGDQLVTNQDEKQAAVLDFYEKLLGESEQRDFSLELSALHLQVLDLTALEADFSETEVFATIKDMPLDKAPGPNGFTGRFYLSCWQLIKEDVMAVLTAVLMGRVAKFQLLNSAFITLLPKKADALEVKDYRPISLVHSVAKLVTKLLVNRLAPRLSDLVSVNQTAFVKGRSIQDNFLLVQQLTRCLHCKKEPHVLFKIDISKAFDSVSWSFLIEVMKHLGFGRRWCNLLCLLLSTSSTRVLVNGEPGDSFVHRRGLRQGDPLSPMLFILVMEVLNGLVVKASQQNLLHPLAVPQISHRISLYADDVIMFLRPIRTDLTLLSQLLDVFGTASGLRTNLAKSSVYPINCLETELQVIQETMACDINSFPCTYLGIPLTIRKQSKADLMPLVDKVADCLPKWKASLLNRAGRLVVVRNVISAIPLHLMTALDLPKWVIKAIDKRQRGFIWSGQERANGGNCLVSWENVQRPLQFGGLEILNLETMGWALRIRWLWLQKTNAARPWEGLPVNVPRNAQALFAAAIQVAVGSGKDTLFWTDRWLQGNSLAELAPNLVLAISKRARKQRTVFQALTNRRWVKDIRGALTVQVLVEYVKVWEMVDDVILQPGVPDNFRWRFTQSGQYSCNLDLGRGFGRVGPLSGVNSSFDRLAKRGLPHPNVCPLCDQEQETVQHLLVSCVFTRQVWTLILNALGLPDLVPQPDGRQFSSWWSGAVSRAPKELKKGLNFLIILVAWEVWKHRNACVFEKIRPCVSVICQEIEKEGSLWCLAGNSTLSSLRARMGQLGL